MTVNDSTGHCTYTVVGTYSTRNEVLRVINKLNVSYVTVFFRNYELNYELEIDEIVLK